MSEYREQRNKGRRSDINNERKTAKRQEKAERSVYKSAYAPRDPKPVNRSINNRMVTAKPPRRRAQEKKRNNDNSRFTGIVVLVILIAVFGFCIHAAFAKNGLEVKVGDETMGVIRMDRDITKEYLELNAAARLEEQLGSKVQLSDSITITPVRVPRNDTVTVDYIISQIKERAAYTVQAALVSANGAEVAVLASVAEAEDMLTSIKAEYVPESINLNDGNFQVDFVEDVKVEEKYVEPGDIMTYDAALQKFTAGTQTEKPYTVQTGDTLLSIAQSSGMTVEELVNKNPGLSIESNIVIGQVLTTVVEKPFISVKTTETITLTDVLRKEVQYQNDDTQPSSYRRVIQQGRDGQKLVTRNIIRINGFEDEIVTVSEQTTQEAVPEIIAVGTR